MKRARKVALISVFDYPRSEYSAYWAIEVRGSDAEGYRWAARIFSHEPAGWEWEGKVTPERPDGLPEPVYPRDLPRLPRNASADQVASDVAAQETRRKEIAKIYDAHPKPVHLLDEAVDVVKTRDEADAAAQGWVLARIKDYRRAESLEPLTDDDVKQLVLELDAARMGRRYSTADRLRGRLKAQGIVLDEPTNAGDPILGWKRKERGHALILGPLLDPLAWLGQKVWDLILMALAYSTTVRNNRLVQVRDAIDGGAGAGLFRIYDGSRPATCGTATTKLAELTFTDPCAGSPSGGVLTFSSITADASADATGTATWFRAVDSTGTCCVDGNVGTSGSDLNLNSTSISSGQQVSVTSCVITEGNA